VSAAIDTSPLRHPPLRLARAEARLHAPEGLDEVEEAMRRFVDGGDRATAMASEHLATGGKRLRARLALAATTALGGALRDAVPWAAAVELLHNATLVHDDIQDRDTLRRGAPTLWARHGTAQAINAGDFLLMLPFLALAETPPQVQSELCRGLADHAVRTVRGQIAELDLLASGALDWDAYLEAIAGKTGALVGLPVYGAGILAGRSRARAEQLSSAFARLGVLFQLQDDVLDLYGEKGRECPGSDLYEGKVSALVVAHLARQPADRRDLIALLETPRDATTEAEVARFIESFVASGSLADVLARIESLTNETNDHPALLEEPALRRVALDLVSVALAPVAHLFSEGVSR
jgi:geranylgeranyl diphosphate synthase, type I